MVDFSNITVDNSPIDSRGALAKATQIIRGFDPKEWEKNFDKTYPQPSEYSCYMGDDSGVTRAKAYHFNKYRTEFEHHTSLLKEFVSKLPEGGETKKIKKRLAKLLKKLPLNPSNIKQLISPLYEASRVLTSIAYTQIYARDLKKEAEALNDEIVNFRGALYALQENSERPGKIEYRDCKLSGIRGMDDKTIRGLGPKLAKEIERANDVCRSNSIREAVLQDTKLSKADKKYITEAFNMVKRYIKANGLARNANENFGHVETRLKDIYLLNRSKFRQLARKAKGEQLSMGFHKTAEAYSAAHKYSNRRSILKYCIMKTLVHEIVHGMMLNTRKLDFSGESKYLVNHKTGLQDANESYKILNEVITELTTLDILRQNKLLRRGTAVAYSPYIYLTGTLLESAIRGQAKLKNVNLSSEEVNEHIRSVIKDLQMIAFRGGYMSRNKFQPANAYSYLQSKNLLQVKQKSGLIINDCGLASLTQWFSCLNAEDYLEEIFSRSARVKETFNKIEKEVKTIKRFAKLPFKPIRMQPKSLMPMLNKLIPGIKFAA